MVQGRSISDQRRETKRDERRIGWVSRSAGLFGPGVGWIDVGDRHRPTSSWMAACSVAITFCVQVSFQLR